MENKRVGILFSGGLESTSLIIYYKRNNFNISLLYIRYGYQWEEIEILYAKKISNYYQLELKIIDYSKILQVNQLGKVKTSKDNIIPLRNLSILTFASLYFCKKNINLISLGLQEDLNYPDANLNYIKQIEKLIQIGLQNNKFKIDIPFYNFTKEQIVQKFNPPLDLIFSCTNPINNQRCHYCFKCKKLDKLIKDKIKILES